MTKISLFFLALILGALSPIEAEESWVIELPEPSPAPTLAIPMEWPVGERGDNRCCPSPKNPFEAEEKRIQAEYVTASDPTERLFQQYLADQIKMEMSFRNQIDAPPMWDDVRQAADRRRKNRPEFFIVMGGEGDRLRAGERTMSDDAFASQVTMLDMDSIHREMDALLIWYMNQVRYGEGLNPYQQLLAYRLISEAQRMAISSERQRGINGMAHSVMRVSFWYILVMCALWVPLQAALFFADHRGNITIPPGTKNFSVWLLRGLLIVVGVFGVAMALPSMLSLIGVRDTFAWSSSTLSWGEIPIITLGLYFLAAVVMNLPFFPLRWQRRAFYPVHLLLIPCLAQFVQPRAASVLAGGLLVYFLLWRLCLSDRERVE